MGLLVNILGRGVPTVLIAVGGYLGYEHFQKEEDQATNSKAKTVFAKGSSHAKAKVKNKSEEGKKAASPKKDKPARIRGLKTTFENLVLTNYNIQLKTQGVVTAPQVTTISSQVTGRIIELSPNFANGAFVKEGEVLAKIDPTDYETAIISAQASLARSLANLAQEKARGEQALRNWQDIGFKEEPNELVLRKPQLREAEANVKSAEAALARALRNQERCVITAPFSGVIRSRMIGNGTVVSGNTKLGEILCTDFAEVRLPLNQRQLEELARSGRTKPEVSFTNALQQVSPQTWTGQIVRREGEMDLAARELFLIARIEDPFSLKNTHETPLSFNQPVAASIPGSVLENVYVINREHFIGIGELVTVLNEKINRLEIDPIWEDETHLIVSADSIPTGSVIATSRMEYAAQGSKVTLVDEHGEKVSLDEDSEKNKTSPATAQKAKSNQASAKESL